MIVCALCRAMALGNVAISYKGKKGMHTIELIGATLATKGADFTIADVLGKSYELRAASVADANKWTQAIEHNIDVAEQEGVKLSPKASTPVTRQKTR